MKDSTDHLPRTGNEPDLYVLLSVRPMVNRANFRPATAWVSANALSTIGYHNTFKNGMRFVHPGNPASRCSMGFPSNRSCHLSQIIHRSPDSRFCSLRVFVATFSATGVSITYSVLASSSRLAITWHNSQYSTIPMVNAAEPIGGLLALDADRKFPHQITAPVTTRPKLRTYSRVI